MLFGVYGLQIEQEGGRYVRLGRSSGDGFLQGGKALSNDEVDHVDKIPGTRGERGDHLQATRWAQTGKSFNVGKAK